MKPNQWLWPTYSKFYDQLLSTPLYLELMNRVVEEICLGNPSNLLDAGCGTGNLEVRLADKYVRIQALDSSTEMLRIAMKKATSNRVQFTVADMNESLAFPSGFFDRIAVVHAIYAVNDPLFTLRELFRVLDSGGKIVIVNPKKGADTSRILQGNLTRLKGWQKPLFRLRMLLITALNKKIINAGRSGVFHFWDESDWKASLSNVGFSQISVSSVYENQDYLVTAKKGRP